MSITKNKPDNEEFNIPSFDFEKSIPNIYAEKYSEDNITIIFKSEDVKTIILDSDVASFFQDSISVNNALRALLSAFSTMKQIKS